ncbi:MAG: 3-hydroxy-3-methylglutaryl-CoA reductase [Hyphomicrobiales bacterium]|nr:3-hydroxy-3-methylglutaryl-CoA reductase [Hyphomicrobiales bacterium]MCP5373723.1 3-hydroxy-3-methylglutaryl-CoA reductase [Hyphomicrobiales bacterium]
MTGLDDLSPSQRLDALRARGLLDPAQVAALAGGVALPLALADGLVVDGDEVILPLASESPDLAPAVADAARRCRGAGGVQTDSTGTLMVGQVVLAGMAVPAAARAQVLARRGELRGPCDAADPALGAVGGGLRRVTAHLLHTDGDGPVLAVNLIVDTKDAMGARLVTAMARAAAPHLESWTGGRAVLVGPANRADHRLVRVRAAWPADDLGGADLRDALALAGRLAGADPHQAATRNKEVMDGITAVLLATGNDTRAAEAAAHAHAARRGGYVPLARWEVDGAGSLAGTLEVPVPAGIVGGATQALPAARACQSILRLRSADHLSRIAAAVGLVAGFAALRAAVARRG